MNFVDISRDRKRQILKDVFGFDDFRPGQEPVVDSILAGHNVLTIMPTGAGKSLCFQVPALLRGGLTIVVSPLVALMQDQVSALKLSGVAAETINSARSRAENVETWRRVASGETHILYMAPERLMTERMLEALTKLEVRLIAIDEAHCISQWGPAFRPEYEALARLRDVFPGVPIAALTATADEVTRADIADRLFGKTVQTYVQGFDRPNIKLTVQTKRNWKQQLLDFMDERRGQSGIVYCLSRKKTEETAALLSEKGIPALPYHAGMTKEARDANQARFMTEAGLIMVATIAFGMGIDKPDVRFVFHTDLPSSLEAYYQEIGRAGRDGETAEAHMLFGLSDIRMRRMFIDEEDSSDDRKRREHQRLNLLLGFCDAVGCRRKILLNFFGEQSEDCANCDTCLDPTPVIDATDDAALALKAIQKSGERFGAAHIIDILLGKETEKVQSCRHDALEMFGQGAHRKKQDWQTVLRQLVAGQFLNLDVAGYGGLEIASLGHDLLSGKTSFQHRPDHEPAGGKRSKRKASEPFDQADVPLSLLSALKRLRLSLAKERNVPAYVIFSDRSLADMARLEPKTLNEFAEVHGVGAAKLRDFGEIFLAAITDAQAGVELPAS